MSELYWGDQRPDLHNLLVTAGILLAVWLWIAIPAWLDARRQARMQPLHEQWLREQAEWNRPEAIAERKARAEEYMARWQR